MLFLRIRTSIIHNVRFMTTSNRDAVGLIGLGKMGSGMAKNLAVKATKPVFIYDLNKKEVDLLTNEFPNLTAVSSPSEVARNASTVITMLPGTDQVEQVYEEIEENIQNTYWVDSSTIDTQASRALAKRAQAKGGWMLDAPVSGGVTGALAGTLTFMVGTPDHDVFDKVSPVLYWMGKNVTYCGENGTGQIAKICNNMLLSIHMMGVSEAMLLGSRLGMDPSLLTSILNTSTGKCWSSEICNPYPGVVPTAPATNGYRGGFSNKLMAKDLRLALKAASDVGFSPSLGSTTSKVYQTLGSDKDFEALDFSSVFKWVSKEAK